MLSPCIYPFQFCFKQVSIILCLNKCPKVRIYLLEMSLQFLKNFGTFVHLLMKNKRLSWSQVLAVTLIQTYQVMGQLMGHYTKMCCDTEDLEKASISFKQLNMAILSNFFRKAHAGIWCLFVLRKYHLLVHLHIQTANRCPCITHLLYPKACNACSQFQVV